MSEQTVADEAPRPRPPAPEPEEGWKVDGRGRRYVQHPSEKRAVFRRGEETIAEALARDASTPPSGDRRPKRKAKSKRPPMPDAPASVDLKELEKVLAEGLQAPAMVCAMYGDEWAANHFTQQGPYLARNLIVASEHNPWLRRKLEAAATGQDAAVKVIAMLGLAGALFGYAVPPIVHFANLQVPEKARQMFNIPPARQPEKHAEGSPAAAPAAEPIAA